MNEEMEYQAGIDKLYNQTQAFGRIDFVKVLFNATQELDIANKKLDKIKEYVETTKFQFKDADVCYEEFYVCGNELLSIIDMNNKEKLVSSEGE